MTNSFWAHYRGSLQQLTDSAGWKVGVHFSERNFKRTPEWLQPAGIWAWYEPASCRRPHLTQESLRGKINLPFNRRAPGSAGHTMGRHQSPRREAESEEKWGRFKEADGGAGLVAAEPVLFLKRRSAPVCELLPCFACACLWSKTRQPATAASALQVPHTCSDWRPFKRRLKAQMRF